MIVLISALLIGSGFLAIAAASQPAPAYIRKNKHK